MNTMTPPTASLRRVADLPPETRLIATPWSRMVRGIGLGQYPVAFDPAVAGRIRRTTRLLRAAVPDDRHIYTKVACALSEAVLRAVDPADLVSEAHTGRTLRTLVDIARAEPNAYYRLMAMCLVLTAAAKLQIPLAMLGSDGRELPEEVLGLVAAIAPDRIRDENQGKHGDYERVSAYTSAFLALGQLGWPVPLSVVRHALSLLDRIPSLFFRGRGGSMLVTAITLLGHDVATIEPGSNPIQDFFDQLDRPDIGDTVAFPSPMSPAFPRIYPLLTMLNAVAVTGRSDFLHGGRDRLAQARKLLAEISPAERTHMSLYYLMALANLGRLEEQVPDLDAFVDNLFDYGRTIDPGTDYFLYGISYPYLIQTALLCGRRDLVTDTLLNRMVDAFADLERDPAGRDNRPYPFSYAVNILAELGQEHRLFESRDRYGGTSAMAWVLSHLSPESVSENNRLTMLDHAIVSWALRLRGPRTEPALFRDFRFPFTA